jgi:hypothetical protein
MPVDGIISEIKFQQRRNKMKKLIVVAVALVMVMGIGIGNASAANSLKQGAIGMNVDVSENFVLTGKYLVMNDLAVLAAFGVGKKGADAKGTDVGIGGGARKYLKMDDFAPFVGGTLFYSTTEDGNTKNLSLMGEFGAEYFLAKQFSIEGKVGFGYTQQETKEPGTTLVGGVLVPTTNNVKRTNIGTDRSAISFNYYF